jgi:hypothetical protein
MLLLAKEELITEVEFFSDESAKNKFRSFCVPESEV